MAPTSVDVFIVLVGLAVFYAVGRSRRVRTSLLPLPPGPKGIPLLGNINDLPGPGILECYHWAKHKDLYGSYRKTFLSSQQLTGVSSLQGR